MGSCPLTLCWFSNLHYAGRAHTDTDTTSQVTRWVRHLSARLLTGSLTMLLLQSLLPCWAAQVLAQLPLLQQLNVKGCPLAADESHPEALLAALPLVEILDGKRVQPRIKVGFQPRTQFLL